MANGKSEKDAVALAVPSKGGEPTDQAKKDAKKKNAKEKQEDNWTSESILPHCFNQLLLLLFSEEVRFACKLVPAIAGLSAPLIIRCDEKDVKLTTYNILSPPLASPQQFPSCDQKDLLKEVRLPKIFARLQKAADEERIIALQEVDLEWAGKLHSFFAERGYAVVFAQYGKQTNGYMGVMLAWPTRCYEAVDVEICRLADTAPKNAWPVQKSKTGLARFGYLTYDGLTDWAGVG
eukprot:g23623.t1